MVGCLEGKRVGFTVGVRVVGLKLGLGVVGISVTGELEGTPVGRAEFGLAVGLNVCTSGSTVIVAVTPDAPGVPVSERKNAERALE